MPTGAPAVESKEGNIGFYSPLSLLLKSLKSILIQLKRSGKEESRRINNMIALLISVCQESKVFFVT
jgi:hypothetical protein